MKYCIMLVEPNKKKLIHYNIFDNAYVYEGVKEIEVRYKTSGLSRDEVMEKLDSLFMYAFWSKREYELEVKDLLEDAKLEKIDGYFQIYPNVPVIADMLIKEWEDWKNE